MRAFMSSDRSRRAIGRLAARVHALGPCGGGYDFANCVRAEGRDADAAVREAERILRETEPAPGYHLSIGPYPAGSRPIAQVALAEALAAFVAE